jgi:iron complex outermembrane receptor protein
MSGFSKRIAAGAAALWLVAPLASAAPSAPSPEDLMFEAPTVVSATRMERSARDVPNSVTVITADQIRASGATSVPELLESVPGLEVMRISRGDINMSARGFNGSSSSQLLVMIDGRSVYLDFFGAVLWERLEVALQDIERIEVIRGPGSSLYGANAFLGTVNIVTKRARDLKPVYLQAGVGPDTNYATGTVARSTDREGMKASFRYKQQDHFSNELSTALNVIGRDRHDTGLRNQFFNGAYELRLSDDSDLRVSAGSSRLKSDIYTGVGVFDYEGPIYYGKVDLTKGPWTFGVFATRLDTDVQTIPTGLPAPPVPFAERILSDVIDLEIGRKFSFGSHDLLLGMNTRRIATDAPLILGDKETDQLYALFGQEEYRINDWLTGFLSLRVDEHPQTGLNVSPRAGMLAKVGEDDRFRMSFARSFQNPTQIELYDTQNIQGFIPAPTTLVRVNGNEDLDPAWVTSYEMGYERALYPRLHAKLDVFYNVLEDFQSFTPTAAGPPLVLSWVNGGRTAAYGAELGFEWKFRDDLWGFSHLAFQSARGPDEYVFPSHKAAAGLRGRLHSRLRYSLTGIYVGRADYEPSAGVTTPEDFVRSRFQVDGFVGFQVLPHFELGLHARNIFHQVRRQFPQGDEIGSEIFVSGTLEF